MKHVLLAVSALVLAGMTCAQTRANPMTALRAALEIDDLPEARRQALLAIDRMLVSAPSCGTVSGLGNPNHFAFLPGEAERVFVQRYGSIGFFNLRSGKVRQVWTAGLEDGSGRGKPVLATNTFSRYFAKLGKVRIDFECGKQPVFDGALSLFAVSVPPGLTVAGTLKSGGIFVPLLEQEFDTSKPSPGHPVHGHSGYQQWIVALPGNR